MAKYEVPKVDQYTDVDQLQAILSTRIANELARGADALEHIAKVLVHDLKDEEDGFVRLLERSEVPNPAPFETGRKPCKATDPLGAQCSLLAPHAGQHENGHGRWEQ